MRVDCSQDVGLASGGHAGWSIGPCLPIITWLLVVWMRLSC